MWIRRINNDLRRLIADEQGLTAIEYALIAGGVFLAIIVAVQLLGSKIPPLFQAVSSHIKG